VSADDACVALLRATSTPVGRARHAWEIAGGRPVYDPIPPELPGRAYVVRCANPRCGLPIIVGQDKGPVRRHCSPACYQGARYWANPEPWRARVRDRAARRRAARIAS
jgi:hypothetical protein